MNKLTKRFLTHFLKKRRSIYLIEAEIQLLPYIIMHCIYIEKGEIRFTDVYEENNRMMLEENTPMSYIPLESVIDIREINPHCLRILLRSGEYQLLEKHTKKRTQHTLKSLKEILNYILSA